MDCVDFICGYGVLVDSARIISCWRFIVLWTDFISVVPVAVELVCCFLGRLTEDFREFGLLGGDGFMNSSFLWDALSKLNLKLAEALMFVEDLFTEP